MTGVAAIPVTAVAAPKVEGVFNVPGIGTNNLIARGSDGNMWVTLQSGCGRQARRPHHPRGGDCHVV